MYAGRIKTRSMMSQYTSFGSNMEKGTYEDPDQDYEIVSGMVRSPTFGWGSGEYTPPKLGGKQAKDVRRYANTAKSNDELIIYARVEGKENRYTGKRSKHTGNVILYVCLLYTSPSPRDLSTSRMPSSA